jgi:alpha-galactosidase
MSRNQLVLDLSRQEVYDYLYGTISGILGRYEIDYIKWDFNRSMAEVYSQSAASARQGEVTHRCYLNLYQLYDRLTREYPHVLFEGCSGGGGRFDAGMLAYSPQIWCSDNTDPIARLRIQYGTSFGYPACTVGAHVSASPNHQTGRHTPLQTRGIVAMAGVFGYELDLTRLSEAACEEIKEQIRRCKQIEDVVYNGNYYRLNRQDDTARYAAWQFVSPDRRRSLLSVVIIDPQANFVPVHVHLKGLNPDAIYQVDGKLLCSGQALMSGGYTFPQMTGDYPSMQIELVQTEEEMQSEAGSCHDPRRKMGPAEF